MTTMLILMTGTRQSNGNNNHLHIYIISEFAKSFPTSVAPFAIGIVVLTLYMKFREIK